MVGRTFLATNCRRDEAFAASRAGCSWHRTGCARSVGRWGAVRVDLSRKRVAGVGGIGAVYVRRLVRVLAAWEDPHGGVQEPLSRWECGQVFAGGGSGFGTEAFDCAQTFTASLVTADAAGEAVAALRERGVRRAADEVL